MEAVYSIAAIRPRFIEIYRECSIVTEPAVERACYVYDCIARPFALVSFQFSYTFILSLSYIIYYHTMFSCVVVPLIVSCRFDNLSSLWFFACVGARAPLINVLL